MHGRVQREARRVEAARLRWRARRAQPAVTAARVRRSTSATVFQGNARKKTARSTTTTHEVRVVAAVDHRAIKVDRHQRAHGDLGNRNAARVDEEARRPRPHPRQ